MRHIFHSKLVNDKQTLKLESLKKAKRQLDFKNDLSLDHSNHPIETIAVGINQASPVSVDRRNIAAKEKNNIFFGLKNQLNIPL